jgi:hypothetical protein
MLYITPTDMETLYAYDPQILIQATNYSDRTSNTINEEVLAGACQVGSDIVSSYLQLIPVRGFRDEFLGVVRVHAARLALDQLAASDPQIREQAKESLEWLKSLSRLSNEDLENISGPSEDGDAGTTVVGPAMSVSFVEEGRRWEVSF